MIEAEFWSRFHEHEAEFNWEEHDAVFGLLRTSLDVLEELFPSGWRGNVAAHLLREVYEAGAPEGVNVSGLVELSVASSSWKPEWDAFDGSVAAHHSLVAHQLQALNAFGRFGIVLWWSFDDTELMNLNMPMNSELLRSVVSVPEWIEKLVEKIDKLAELCPDMRKKDGLLEPLLETKLRAQARLKYDLGKSLTVHELAALSGVTVKRLQNAIYAKTEDSPIVDKKSGLIRADNCTPWLEARDYYRSIWKDVTIDQESLSVRWPDVEASQDQETSDVEDDFVFVPVDSRGDMFTPDLFRPGRNHDGGYTIGPKFNERVISDYVEALLELQKLDVPRWRRPNQESGNWGIVTGREWRRVSLRSLQGHSEAADD